MTRPAESRQNQQRGSSESSRLRDSITRALRIAGMATIIAVQVLMVVSSGVDAQSGVPLRDRLGVGRVSDATTYFTERSEPYYSAVKAEYDQSSQQRERVWTWATDGASFPSDGPASDRTVTAAGVSAIVAGSDVTLPIASGYEGRSGDTLLFGEDYEWFEWNLEVPEDGLYELAIDYRLFPGTANPAVFTLAIDGSVPFLEAYRVEFPRFYRDRGEPRVNNVGDEVRPQQEELPGWRTRPVSDSEGKYPQPLQFHLEAGNRRLRLTLVEQGMAVGEIYLRRPAQVPSYSEVRAEYQRRGFGPATVSATLQAESSVIEKSDPTLRRESDGDPLTVPSEAGRRLLNTMGAWRWRNGGQEIVWQLDVPETGLYRIGMRFGQFWTQGLPSYRRIQIDGHVPFRELLAYAFPYDREWQFTELSTEEGEPFEFYLTEGAHTLSMTVQMGEVVDVIHAIADDSLLLSKVVRQIIMITGSDPDPNYDYDLEDKIPTLLADLETLRQSMLDKVDKLTEASDRRPPMANNFLTIANQLSEMIRDPDRISRKLNDLANAQSSLGAWYLSTQQMPLSVDWIVLAGEDYTVGRAHSNFLEKLRVTIKNFVVSFTKDYDSVGNIYDAGSGDTTLLNVWVSRGTEWAEIIKEMADEQFSGDTGVLVNMNVLPPNQLNAGGGAGAQPVNALMLAIASDRAPDIALGTSTTSPVEFAIRDAAVDLKQFDDYDAIVNRFLPGIMAPFEYRGGVYGFPETMDFRLLFYRKDIIQELGIELPETWVDVYRRVLPVLYQNGMQFYYAIPSELGAIDHNFAPFLYQHGGTFYKENGARSALDSPEAFLAFREYTELYTSYGIPVVANFYNRIRTGEMPIGVGTYGIYMRLAVAAPELAGRWGVAPFPGTLKPDGTIDRTVGGIAQQSDVILAQTEHREESWQFLKWWTSAPVQEQFGRELEALIGAEARWNTANIEAFERLAWKRDDLGIIRDSWRWARDMPVVLGGYFTGRHIVNAWNRVVLSNSMVRDSLEQAVEDINRELRMKQEEYGVQESIVDE